MGSFCMSYLNMLRYPGHGLVFVVSTINCNNNGKCIVVSKTNYMDFYT